MRITRADVGAEVQIDALDQQPATLEVAKKLSATYPSISFIEGNILEWDAPDPYDIVLCTLALHHFSEDDAVRVLRKCSELSRKFVLVSDLRRGWAGTIGVHLLTATIFREPMTRFDARLSIARAFSLSELAQLAQRAGWKNFAQRSFTVHARRSGSKGVTIARFFLKEITGSRVDDL